MSSAREEILGRIRSALGPAGVASAETLASSYARLDRHYQQTPTLDRDACLHLFTERLLEYGADVHPVTTADLPGTLARIVHARQLSRVLVPPGLPTAWLREIPVVEDALFSAHELDSFPGVLTTATLGIAESGTIVLQTLPGQGRRAVTLVPDFHLCVVFTSVVVETAVEAFRLLGPTRTLPTTLFSGPSATADIEMTRIKGVHGPRFVDVLLVRDEAGQETASKENRHDGSA